MSNSFNISSSVEIAALDAKVVLVDAVVDAIRGTDVVNIQSNINDNETKIDTIVTDVGVIDGIVDAIKTKTDATPQKVRGHFNCVGSSSTSDTWASIINVTGQGKLYMIGIQCKSSADTLELRITIDGKLSEVLSHTADADRHWVIPFIYDPNTDEFRLSKVAVTGSDFNSLNVEFDTSLLIELRRSAGTANWVGAKIIYSLDDF